MAFHPPAGSKVVLATGNAGKLRELQAVLADAHLEIVSQADYVSDAAIEDGLSFVENAIIKARHAARASGLPAIADDSGLEVDALDGEPGIHSARYAGVHADDAANNAKLLDALKEIPDAQRSARFHCVIACIAHADDPTPLICHASWEGRILHAPRGSNGFGYDPLFFALDQGCASAELPPEVKNQVSHRGQALKQLLYRLQD